MSSPAYQLAKKYAQAFINSFGNKITEQRFVMMQNVQKLLAERSDLLFLLSVPRIPDQSKINVLQSVLSDKLFEPLIILLVKQKRAQLLPRVLEHIIIQYRAKHNIIQVNITSSHQLSDDTLAVIAEFISHITHQTTTYNYAIDKRLIAGIRIQSDTLLWEHSIRKKLRHVKTMLIG